MKLIEELKLKEVIKKIRKYKDEHRSIKFFYRDLDNLKLPSLQDFSFKKDDEFQYQFEQQFPHALTKDQEQCLKEIKEALKHEENVMGVVISGAGPAILVISYGNNLDKIRQTVSDVWLDLNVKSKILTLQVESNGAQIID